MSKQQHTIMVCADLTPLCPPESIECPGFIKDIQLSIQNAVIECHRQSKAAVTRLKYKDLYFVIMAWCRESHDQYQKALEDIVMNEYRKWAMPS